MSIGGFGPIGLDPSKKQSIGVIQMQGISFSSVGFIACAFESLSISNSPGLKQISLKVQFLKYINVNSKYLL